MTVEDLSTTVTYSGDGVTAHWPYTFPLQRASDLQVWITDPVGHPTQLFTNFEVDTINARVIYPITGDPLAADGSTLTLLRVVPLTQDTIFTNTGPLPAESIADALDKLTMICQQIQEFIQSQCVQIPTNPSLIFDPTLPIGTAIIPGTALVVNGSGNGWTLSAVATPASGSRIYRGPLVGTLDGTNKVFTVVSNFVSGTEELFVGGILQDAPGDYSVTGANKITFVTAPQPAQAPLLMSYTTQ